MKAYEKAFSQYGLSEVRGTEHNAEIVKYFTELGFSSIIDDETAWCSAFVNWCCMKTGFEKTMKLNARSWLDCGDVVDLKNAVLGDIAIFYRGDKNGWKGHVAFYCNHDDKYIYVLGGNQGNMVQISPYNRDRLLGVRRVIETYKLT